MLDFPQVAQAWSPRLRGVLRIVAGLLLLQHGTAKLFGFPHIEMFNNLSLFSLLGVSGILEFFGGLLLIAGILTRPVAFILAGEMAVAYFLVHAPKGFFPVLNQGELAALYCFVFLYLSVAGGGAFRLFQEPEESGHKD